MLSFHNNQLNTVSLYDSDDQTYTPTKRLAKAKTMSNETGASATSAGTPKRKRGGDTDTPVKEHKNATTPTDNTQCSGTDTNVAGDEEVGMFSIANQPNRRFPEYDQTCDGNVDRFGNQLPSGYNFFGGRLHLNGYDIDNRVPLTYPTGAPLKNSFANPDIARRFGIPLTNNNLDRSNVVSGLGSYNDPNSMHDGTHWEAHAGDSVVEDVEHVEVKEEKDQSDQLVSATVAYDSEYEESEFEDQRVSKTPKINKDGAPRKPRQPRAKLLKWTDNDWKNVVLGIIWACGETGTQIPFDQAAQVVDESCTAGALQQAVLKLRGKQMAEGNQIPSLRMAWTRKTKHSASSSSTANVKNDQESGSVKTMLAKKKPTRWSGNQTLIVTLKRAYQEAHRVHLEVPYMVKRKFKKFLPKPERATDSNASIVRDNTAGNIEAQSATLHYVDDHEDQVMGDADGNFSIDQGDRGNNFSDYRNPEYFKSVDQNCLNRRPDSVSTMQSLYWPEPTEPGNGLSLRPLPTSPNRNAHVVNSMLYENDPEARSRIFGDNDSRMPVFANGTGPTSPPSSSNFVNDFGTPISFVYGQGGYEGVATGPLGWVRPTTPLNSDAANDAIDNSLQSGAHNPQGSHEYVLFPAFDDDGESNLGLTVLQDDDLDTGSYDITDTLEDPFT